MITQGIFLETSFGDDDALRMIVIDHFLESANVTFSYK